MQVREANVKDSSTTLLVIDMQRGCFAGEPPRHDAEAKIARINALARAIRANGPVIFIQHTDAAEGLAQGSDAWQLLDSLDRSPHDCVVEKTACDAFLETGLDSLLKDRGVTDLIIVGCATDFCVDTTVRSAAAHGYKVSVASDAHTTRDRPHLAASKIIEHHNFMWEELLLPRHARVRVAPTEQLLAEIAPAPALSA
jgi:nicotinamidase-related amidase